MILTPEIKDRINKYLDNLPKGKIEELLNKHTMDKDQALEKIKELETYIKGLEQKESLVSRWEDIKDKNGYYLDYDNRISRYIYVENNDSNKNIIKTEVQAKSIQVLPELLQLRDSYRNGWIPDWNDGLYKDCIYFHGDKILKNSFISICMIFSFQNGEVRNTFYNNFKDKLEIYFKGLV